MKATSLRGVQLEETGMMRCGASAGRAARQGRRGERGCGTEGAEARHGPGPAGNAGAHRINVDMDGPAIKMYLVIHGPGWPGGTLPHGRHWAIGIYPRPTVYA